MLIANTPKKNQEKNLGIALLMQRCRIAITLNLSLYLKIIPFCLYRFVYEVQMVKRIVKNSHISRY